MVMTRKERKRRRKAMREYLDSLTDVDWDTLNDCPVAGIGSSGCFGYVSGVR
jgi:hypothetical protein